jgi:O-antigen/teichoic acid export membrane protein
MSSKISFKQGNSDKESLFANTVWMLIANGSKLILQAGYFIIIARALGPAQYGAFVGATSLVSIFAPFASLGSGNLLVKNVSRNRLLFSEYWGNALLMIGLSGTFFLALITFISSVFLPKTISTELVVIAAVTDLFFFRVLDTAGQAFQSVQWLSKTAQLNILPGITRILAALALIVFFKNPNALEWTYLYLISTALSSFAGVFLVTKCLGSAKIALNRIKLEIVQGFYFSLGLSSQTIYNDIDKTMLANLSSLDATGIYAAAYRLIDVAFVPVRSLLGASYARFFQQGSTGIEGSLRLAKRLTPLAGAYAIFAGVALYYCAPIVPIAFGKEFAETAEALRWLAPLPFLKTMHYFAADSLSGADFQGLRSVMQVGVAIFNVAINIWLIPQYSWKGAAWSSLASDATLMLGLWTIIIVLYYSTSHNTKSKLS